MWVRRTAPEELELARWSFAAACGASVVLALWGMASHAQSQVQQVLARHCSLYSNVFVSSMHR